MFASMQRPIDVALPHKLGREEARRRIAANIDKLESHIPGGADVVEPWDGDTLKLDIGTMGQSVDARSRSRRRWSTAGSSCPALLSLFAAPIEAMLTKGAATCCSRTSATRLAAATAGSRADAPFRDHRFGTGRLLHRRSAGQGLWRRARESTSSTAMPCPTA